jgi:putative salt-induced outer membrane protein
MRAAAHAARLIQQYGNYMKTTHLASAVLLALPLAALAADPPPPSVGWSGTGEAGLSVASGNTKAQNLNAKLDLKFNDGEWKDDFYLLALRNKANVTDVTTAATRYDLTANRYEAGASFGYKFDERSYLVGAGRYEHDEFSPYDYQYILSLGYGYQLLKNASDELAFEVGAGYKVVQPTSYFAPYISTPPGTTATGVTVHPDSDSNVVARGKMEYKHVFSDAVSFVDVFVIEAGSGNKFFQNDAGLAVKMNSHLALKIGLQTRHNSEVNLIPSTAFPAGLGPVYKKTDELFTTNLVYNF